MNADREALKAAVLTVLDDEVPYDFEGYISAFGPDGGYEQISPNELADAIAVAIVDAVTAVDGQEGTVDWAVRCRKTGTCLHFSPGPHIFATRQGAERYINIPALGEHELVSRRRFVGEWERVTE